MFIVLLKFTEKRAEAGALMEEHNAWIQRGFDAGVFALLASLQPRLGGGIVAQATTLAELQARVSDDPFVANGVVTAEILELTPSRADEQFAFLLG